MATESNARSITEASAPAPWGGTLNYLEWPGEGTPLVLLHGLGGNAYWWVPLAEQLPDRHILAIDMPGHGDTGPLDEWDLARTAASVYDAVKGLLGCPAIWGGQSWGGKLAALVAALHPADVEALVLMESAPVQGLPIPPEAFVNLRYGHELGSWDSLADAAESARKLPQYEKWSEDVEVAFAHGLERRADGTYHSKLSRERAVEIARNAVGMDHSEAVSGVKCPIALIISEESVGWQEQTNVKAFPDAKKIVLPGGHWIQMDNTLGCAEAVRSWLLEI